MEIAFFPNDSESFFFRFGNRGKTAKRIILNYRVKLAWLKAIRAFFVFFYEKNNVKMWKETAPGTSG